MNALLPHPHANTCPACGQPNQCAMAAGADAQDCWCMHTPVSPDALARLPAGERGQRCICPVCARPPDGGSALGKSTAPL
ncbi:cysteine-rich CWC family protein [Simplicispira lacusdiani]|uniref:cysteine-rich CWC family protein n=1 Tax=Simplicispira lacusdiani TaxID=2213010 RepID=UPI000E732B8B|nr:cysteine-rich CWC family protein [Simplicispira lacusdiani]